MHSSIVLCLTILSVNLSGHAARSLVIQQLFEPSEAIAVDQKFMEKVTWSLATLTELVERIKSAKMSSSSIFPNQDRNVDPKSHQERPSRPNLGYEESVDSVGSTNSAGNGSVTTTQDPMEVFCKEACQEGLAGDECDCADHILG